jgi:hypothetical protein
MCGISPVVVLSSQLPSEKTLSGIAAIASLPFADTLVGDENAGHIHKWTYGGETRNVVRLITVAIVPGSRSHGAFGKNPIGRFPGNGMAANSGSRSRMKLNYCKVLAHDSTAHMTVYDEREPAKQLPLP